MAGMSMPLHPSSQAAPMGAYAWDPDMTHQSMYMQQGQPMHLMRARPAFGGSGGGHPVLTNSSCPFGTEVRTMNTSRSNNEYVSMQEFRALQQEVTHLKQGLSDVAQTNEAVLSEMARLHAAFMDFSQSRSPLSGPDRARRQGAQVEGDEPEGDGSDEAQRKSRKRSTGAEVSTYTCIMNSKSAHRYSGSRA
jgi:hypothetical protein